MNVVASDAAGNHTASVAATVTGTGWTVSGIDVSSLNDGTITFTVTAADAAGNQTTATQTSTKSIVSVNISSVTSTIDIANENPRKPMARSPPVRRWWLSPAIPPAKRVPRFKRPSTVPIGPPPPST